jgi:hypothetical protein
MNKISYSQYSLWANCPLAWKLKYVDGHRIDDTSIHTIFGTAMHEVIQEWLEVLYNQSEKFANNLDLSENLKEKLSNLFKENTKLDDDGNKIFLCDKKELSEFYMQGCLILDYVQQHRKKIFPTQATKLFGIEHELSVEVAPGVVFNGFIDIVTHNTATDKYVVYDLKTSKSGWNDYQKSDPVKLQQILLYKKFLSQTLNIPEDKISTEYIILKRIISETSQYPVPRVSKFEPSNGKPSIKKAWAAMEKFITECFDGEGNYNTSNINPTPSKSNCRWCKFRDKKDLCSHGII